MAPILHCLLQRLLRQSRIIRVSGTPNQFLAHICPMTSSCYPSTFLSGARGNIRETTSSERTIGFLKLVPNSRIFRSSTPPMLPPFIDSLGSCRMPLRRGRVRFILGLPKMKLLHLYPSHFERMWFVYRYVSILVFVVIDEITSILSHDELTLLTYLYCDLIDMIFAICCIT